jgi:hypothetical protein
MSRSSSHSKSPSYFSRSSSKEAQASINSIKLENEKQLALRSFG